MISSSMLAMSVLLTQLWATAGEVFLSKDGGNVFADKQALKGILFEEMEGFFGRDSSKGRVATIEERLMPLYRSLPKDSHGGLGHATVRYALHRFFLQEHAWHVKGLGPVGRAWNDSSPTSILTDQVPSYIQGMFEEHLGDRGFGLHELAVLGACLEHIVKAETVARVETAYTALNLSTTDMMDEETVNSIADMQQVLYLLSIPLNDLNKIRRASKHMERIYPGWKDTQAFVRDTRLNLAYNERDRSNPFQAKSFDFHEIVHVIEEVNDQFGHYQDIECRSTRDLLLEREYKGSGRMRLADFYSLALEDMRFSESIDYLRQLGALDESEPNDPRVIVSNYMYGINNCFESSAYYSVCCLDECNVLLGHLERTFAAPDALPGQVADALARLPSSTVVAPRNLSSMLLERLYEIAAVHGGTVPLHGRLFAQVLHHAYPRECPVPHVSGTIAPKSVTEYKKDSSNKVTVKKDELRQHVDSFGGSQIAPQSVEDWMYAEQDAGERHKELDQSLPWSDEEELLVPRDQRRPETAGSSWLLRLTVMLLAVAAVVSGLLQQASTAKSSLDRVPDDGKQFV